MGPMLGQPRAVRGVGLPVRRHQPVAVPDRGPVCVAGIVTGAIPIRSKPRLTPEPTAVIARAPLAGDAAFCVLNTLFLVCCSWCAPAVIAAVVGPVTGAVAGSVTASPAGVCAAARRTGSAPAPWWPLCTAFADGWFGGNLPDWGFWGHGDPGPPGAAMLAAIA
jgi:hypothetical protein